MHGKQDGMGDGPCKGGDTRVPNVLDLNEACCPLYTGARCSKLSTTLILMNIYTTHGCSNKFLDELLFLLHKFILPVDNCLPSTMYHAKSLTWNAISSMHAKWGAYCIRVFMQIFKNAQNVVPLNTNK
jgi:hypothetical protein